MIEGVEIEVGEELAGEVADGNSGSEWGIRIDFWAVVDNAIDEPQRVRAFEFAPD